MESRWQVILAWSAAALLLFSLILVTRILAVLHRTHSRSVSPPTRPPSAKASLAIFLGSGGHTAEMVRLVRGLDWDRYSTRTYLISSGDQLSETKALALEATIGSGTFTILRIPRARHVLQSYLTSPFTTLHSLAHCVWHIALHPLSTTRRVFADVFLLNGPGSCVPIAFSAFLPRIFGLPSPALIYIESLARTRRLSLSARIVIFVVDRFFVQWESLRDALVEKDTKDREGRGPKLKLRARVEFEGWLV